MSLVGGHNINDICRRIMRHLMSPTIMCLFSLTGRKGGKRPFKETIFFSVVKDSARISSKHLGISDRDIEIGISEVLKHAKDRSLPRLR